MYASIRTCTPPMYGRTAAVLLGCRVSLAPPLVGTWSPSVSGSSASRKSQPPVAQYLRVYQRVGPHGEGDSTQCSSAGPGVHVIGSSSYAQCWVYMCWGAVRGMDGWMRGITLTRMTMFQTAFNTKMPCLLVWPCITYALHNCCLLSACT